MHTLFSLHNKRALVTGAGSGIGAAIALLYAKAGASLILCDINSSNLEKQAELCKNYSPNVTTLVADVGRDDVGELLLKHINQTLGGLDILVNNAGMLTQAPVEELTLAMWDDMLRIDLRSIFLCSQAVIPGMKKQGWGRIINISSQLALKGGSELSHYSAAKAGAIGLTKSLALELAPYNVLVNAIAPGPIETPLVDGISADWKKAKAKELPLQRFGHAEEIAPTALLLASDPGGNIYVGQTLGPNSGDVMP